MSLDFWKLQFQVSPIFLTGGVAGQLLGAALPITSLLDPGGLDDLDNAFAAFNVMPGGTLISQTIAQYPFVNQSTAANATIREPLNLSMTMMIPPRAGWAQRLAIMTALKATLDNHNNAGGTFTVMTPLYQYDNLILLNLTDISGGQGSIPQTAYRWDFNRPLVTMQEAQASQNTLMSKLSAGLPTGGALAGGGGGALPSLGTPIPGYSDASLGVGDPASLSLNAVPAATVDVPL